MKKAQLLSFACLLTAVAFFTLTLNDWNKSISQVSTLNNGPSTHSRAVPIWEEENLLNISHFTWINQNNEEFCRRREGEDVNLRIIPVLIHTARSHFEERQVIRDTWGSLSIYNGWSIRIAFMLGLGATDSIESEGLEKEAEEIQLEEEARNFNDLVIGSFTDSYRNLTYKHLMGYKWVLNYYKESPVVLKFDDDVFVDIITWLDWLEQDLTGLKFKNQNNSVHFTPQIYCKLWPRSTPFRQIDHKWYTSYEEWPHEFWPPFCSGWAYSIMLPLVKELYSISNQVKFNFMDDLFVTGLLLQEVRNQTGEIIPVGDITQQFVMNPGKYEKDCEINNEQATTTEVSIEDEGLLNFWAVKEALKGINQKRIIVAKVERGGDFRRNMECLWNQASEIMIDRIKKSKEHVHFVKLI